MSGLVEFGPLVKEAKGQKVPKNLLKNARTASVPSTLIKAWGGNCQGERVFCGILHTDH